MQLDLDLDLIQINIKLKDLRDIANILTSHFHWNFIWPKTKFKLMVKPIQNLSKSIFRLFQNVKNIVPLGLGLDSLLTSIVPLRALVIATVRNPC